MDYQKIINQLDNTQNQPCKFRTRDFVEINHGERMTLISDGIKFTTSVVRSSLFDYGDT